MSTDNGSAASAPLGLSLSLQWALPDTEQCKEQNCCMEIPFSYISTLNYISKEARNLQGALWQETQSSSLPFAVSVALVVPWGSWEETLCPATFLLSVCVPSWWLGSTGVLGGASAVSGISQQLALLPACPALQASPLLLSRSCTPLLIPVLGFWCISGSLPVPQGSGLRAVKVPSSSFPVMRIEEAWRPPQHLWPAFICVAQHPKQCEAGCDL